MFDEFPKVLNFHDTESVFKTERYGAGHFRDENHFPLKNKVKKPKVIDSLN